MHMCASACVCVYIHVWAHMALGAISTRRCISAGGCALCYGQLLCRSYMLCKECHVCSSTRAWAIRGSPWSACAVAIRGSPWWDGSAGSVMRAHRQGIEPTWAILVCVCCGHSWLAVVGWAICSVVRWAICGSLACNRCAPYPRSIARVMRALPRTLSVVQAAWRCLIRAVCVLYACCMRALCVL
jgi:hypothetical protein